MRRSAEGTPVSALGRVVLLTLVSAALLTAPSRGSATQDASLPYLDPALTFEARAADLVSRMTAEEKIGQLMNNAPAIPRLGVPAYEWWNECLHGVARAGAATVFPQAIGMAASFDTALMHEVATAISDEARAKHHEFARRGLRARYQGLTFWSPNINIFRDPRWGRGQETYGEDPFLTARMGVAFVKGLQGDDPRYLKVVATAKHFAVHSGPEKERHVFDARPSERDLYETYLPAFRALVQEGHVASVMSAYNRVNGESATASQRLLLDVLRRDWGFDGYVVSDCGAVDDIYKTHKITPTAEAAAALAVRKGCDIECGSTYKALGAALAQGLIAEADIDTAAARLFRARFALGMFDPPERVPYARIPYSVNQSAPHDALARRMAQESLVLLKNDGLLPLRRDLGTLAVIGPNADEVMTLLGNYYGTPASPVTVLAGIRQAVSPSTRVVFARGADLVEGRLDPRAVAAIPSAYLRAPDGARGLRGEYFQGPELQGTPMLSRVDPTVEFRWDRNSPTSDLVARGELPTGRALANDDFSVRWTGQLLPPASGLYELTVTGDDGYRLEVDGHRLIDEWTTTPRARARSAKVELEAGKAYDVRLEYFESVRDSEIRLAWVPPGARDPFEEAIGAARAADAVVFVAGLTGDVEGEEMNVSYPGFAGGDRTSLALPATQEKLLRAVRATGKPVALVLMAGSALGVEWAQRNVPAILLAWYPGQQGGTAVADVLFGDVNPSGRLPVTFYRSVDQLPPFSDYDMKGRTYRYFGGDPLYPFGHGLSYTRFEYSGLELDRTTVSAGEGDTVTASLRVKNAGPKAGAEVVQLYVRAVSPKVAMPIKDLRGFERITLAPGEERRLSFRLTPAKDFARYDEGQRGFVVDPGAFEVQAGASSHDIRLTRTVRVTPAVR
jgi:beta-glucosidase